MIKGRRTGMEAVLGLVSALALGGPAFANDKPDAEAADTSGEIIVTAQKRAESLQKVPFSIQALGEEKLERLNVKDFVDVARQLPSVSIRHIVPGVGNIFMRGISSGPDGGASGSLPSVGVYLDEQPVTTIQGTLDIHMYDIARVEALAGPQGTLYGASSQSGTLRIITNKPEPGVARGRIDVEANAVSHGGVGYSIAGMINLPLADKVTLRTVLWNRTDAGYIDNVPATRFYPTSGVTINNAAVVRKDFNPVFVKGARAALRIDLDDNWTVTPGAMVQETISRGQPYQTATAGELKVDRFFPDYRDDTYWQASLTVEGKIGDLDVTYAGAYLERKFNAYFDYSDYSYFYDTLYGLGQYWVNNNGVPIDPSQTTHSISRYSRTSHELRIATPQDKPLRATLGGFFQFQQHDLQSQYKIQNLASFASVTAWPNTIWLTDQQRRDRDLAVFGEVSYDVLPSVTVTAGGRLFKATQSLVGFFGLHTYEAFCTAPRKVGAGPCTNVDARASGDGFTPKVNLSWRIDKDRMVYATYSRGYRAGGINRDPRVLPYAPDYLTNYEIGWKTSWNNGKFRFNGALFNDNWDDFQILVLGVQGIAQMRNVGQARVRGFETDLSAALGGGFSLNAAGSFIDAKLKQNYCGQIDANGKPVTNCPTPVAPAGTRLPLSSRFKGSLSLRYDWTMDNTDLFLESAVAYQGAIWSSLPVAERAIVGQSPAFATVDLSGGANWSGWRASFYVRNLFDNRGELARLTSCQPVVCSRVYEVPVRPRNFGIKIGRDF